MKKILGAITIAMLVTLTTTTIWAGQAKYNTPEFKSETVVGDEGLTNDINYEFSDGSIVASPDDVLLMLNGEFVPYKCLVKNNTTFVPLRAVCEAFGKDVSWDESNRQVMIGDVVLTIGSTTVHVNDDSTTVSFIPFIENDTTYVPICFVVEEFGKAVGYIDKNQKYIELDNSVFWADEKELTDGSAYTVEQMTLYVKENLMSVESLFVEEGNLEAFTPESVEGIKYAGQIGRYAIFNSSTRPLLVDMQNKAIYEYVNGHEYAGIYKIQK